jgi:SAM-dependent methyltransferase
MNLTSREESTYTDALSLPSYGDFSPGEVYAPVFASLADPRSTVLDAGAGTGAGMRALQALGYRVTGVDLPDLQVPGVRAGVCLWRPLPPPARGERYDYVYCTDVLEHIPPEFTMLCVARMMEVAERGLFLSIALVPDHFGSWVGHPLHLTVRRYDEWLDNLRELATVTDARDLGTTGLYFLEPR